jgi:hypothetical protein
MYEEVILMGAADWEQLSSASTTPAEVCRNHERAESLEMFIKKKTCQTFVLDETREPMSGVALRSKGLTLPRWIRLSRSHSKEEIVCDASEDAIDVEPTESPVEVRRAIQSRRRRPDDLVAARVIGQQAPAHATAGRARDIAPPRLAIRRRMECR